MIARIFFLLGIALLSQPLAAATINVSSSSELNSALTTAIDNDSIFLEPGEYTVNLLINKSVILKGRSTKDVILKALDNTQPVIAIDNVVNVKIQNMTFKDSQQAIYVYESVAGLNLTIENNAFFLRISEDLNTLSYAIQVYAPDVTIKHNVFYKNNYSVFTNEDVITISRNIFSDNATLPGTFGLINNCFKTGNSNIEAITNNTINADIRFVDPENADFHLKAGSDCIIDEGFASEDVYGAYGGDSVDGIPSAIKIDTFNTSNLANSEVLVGWAHNEAREIDDYKVYYSESPLKGLNTEDDRKGIATVTGIGTNADNDGNLSVTVTLPKNATEIPQEPTLISVQPRNEKLIVKWTAVSGVDSYKLYYTGRENNPISVEASKTGYTISGLSNDAVYEVWVSAVDQLKYYFQVAAVTANNDVDNFQESFFLFGDQEVTVGDVEESLISNKISQQPEALSAYPQLPNEGCFIATAAFGYYSADEVMVLRHFRDKHLLTNAPGTTFVKWYYTYGPIFADLIRQSEALKAMVRIALYPLILMAELLEFSKFLFALVMLLLSYLFLQLVKATVKRVLYA
ncbi:MAG: CFI-box-CTERM domain-containing protein [Gammaproteobacteria bacterium]|nr:CFI-box-CTERM domain-containing protein [Gammaproteobacteria bacterium]